MATSATLLDASTSTSETSRVYLDPGVYLFTLETANASASVTLRRYQNESGGTGMSLEEDGSAIALTPTVNAKKVVVSGEYYTAENADGSSAATVKARQVDRV